MTHTLHRRGDRKSLEKDYILLSMAAQGYNSRGAGRKLASNLRVMVEAGPVNFGDDNQGGIFTGCTYEELIANAGEKAYMAAVYDSKEALREALLKLKREDNGMPVIVSGLFSEVFSVLREIGLKPHTVHMALGVHGKTELLPPEDIMELMTMCGHGMLCRQHIENIVGKVKSGEMDLQAAGKDLARPCTCAMVNPTKVSAVIGKMCGIKGGQTG